ncbi:MAG: hypothetical protein HMLIMOIP_001865 [Candidatus Nitrosomirales archaeon]
MLPSLLLIIVLGIGELNKLVNIMLTKLDLRKFFAILGSAMLCFSIISYNVATIAVQELGNQSDTNFFPDEIKQNERESNRIAYNFAQLAVTSIPIFLVGVPITIHGFVHKFSMRMVAIMSALLLFALLIFYILAYPFT